MESFEYDQREIVQGRGASVASLENQLQLRTPTSMSASLDDLECITVASHPPTSIKILPVIRSDSHEKHEYGTLRSLEPDLLDNISKLLDVLGTHDKFTKVGLIQTRTCVERLLHTKSSSSWTHQQSGCFACKTCFNRRLPCMRAINNHVWVLLPLPVEARHQAANWQNGAYYIHPGNETTANFPGIWRKKDS
jgi:hypothetical protein